MSHIYLFMYIYVSQEKKKGMTGKVSYNTKRKETVSTEKAPT